MTEGTPDPSGRELRELMECPVPTDLSGCVAVLANVVTKGMVRVLAPYDLSPSEFALLRVCLMGEETTATVLSQALPVDTARISRMVNRLVGKGFLARRRQREDRRVVWLRLTDEGRSTVSDLVQRLDEFESDTLAGLEATDLEALIATTCQIRINFVAREKAAGPPPSEPATRSGFPGYLEGNN